MAEKEENSKKIGLPAEHVFGQPVDRSTPKNPEPLSIPSKEQVNRIAASIPAPKVGSRLSKLISRTDQEGVAAGAEDMFTRPLDLERSRTEASGHTPTEVQSKGDKRKDEYGTFPLEELAPAKLFVAEEEAKKAKTVSEPLIDLSLATNPFRRAGIGGVGAKPPKIKPGTLKLVVFWLLGLSITLIILWLIANAPAIASRVNFLRQDLPISEPRAQDRTPVLDSQPEFVGGPDTLALDSLGLSAPAVYSTATDEKGILEDLRGGIVHYGNTPLPGEPGNSVFFGHSSNYVWSPGGFKYIFSNNDRLEVGDAVTIVYAGRKYVYEVTGKRVVTPKEIDVLETKSPQPTITLISCYPVGTSWKRLVVIAKQIIPVPPADGANSGDHLPRI